MTDETDTQLTIVYNDPIQNTTVFTDAKEREECVEGDYLLNNYISKLDEEIFSDVPLFSPSGVDEWYRDNLSAMVIQLLDKARTHGWACVNFSKKAPIWQVLSEQDRSDWIKDDDGNIIGVNIKNGDNSNGPNVDTIPLYFGKNQCYLLKYKEGNNKNVFAYGDLDQSMWTVATITREIQSQIDMMARKPEFYHVVYGNPTPAQRAAVMAVLDNTSVLIAFAASKNAVEEIRVIQRASFGPLMEVVKEKIRHFAGLTRLPLAYYNGERTTGGGTGGAAENMVEVKIDRRKQHIFNIVKPLIIQIYQERYNITLTDIEMDMNKVEKVQTDNNTITEEVTPEEESD